MDDTTLDDYYMNAANVQQKYYDELVHYLTVVNGKKQKGIPLTTWKEELADDLLTDWTNTILEDGADDDYDA